MVAKITIPASIRKALNYNEQKVKQGYAECIYAHHFLQDADRLKFHEKLSRFQSLISLNKRATTNTIHISLNFGVDEKIDREKLIEIAMAYMTKIGFSEQPYLVYQHRDAGHPHIHIVSTNIQNDGKRISLHNIGRNQSNAARKELEAAYNLQRAESRRKITDEQFPTPKGKRVVYGKSETKRGITNVLDYVLPRYRYATLPELNAILKLYNVTADRGKEDSVVYRKGGLLYRMLDENGNKVGVPIKASSIYSQPTLSNLEKKFTENGLLKAAYRRTLKTSIDWIMKKPPKSLEGFKEALQREKITLVIRQNETGIVYGLTYVDHNTKCVFNGSELGKEFSAKGILSRCGEHQSIDTNPKRLTASEDNNLDVSTAKMKTEDQRLSKMLEGITAPSESYQNVPFELRKRKKKKRKHH
jgi:hypothetical protein